MIVLLDAAAASVTAAAVLCVWLSRRLWLFQERPALRATVTATVVPPIPSHQALPGRPAAAITAGRIIPGEVER